MRDGDRLYRLRNWVLSAMWLVGVLAGAAARAQTIAVPQELAGWRDWALQGADYRRCPFLISGSPTDAGAYRCAWPEGLQLVLDAHGGTFAQGWQVYADSWVVLPGDAEHWPQELRDGGVPLAAVLRDGVPQARLAPGHHVLGGRFAWSQRPEQLRVAGSTALVELTLDGTRIAQPERPDGAVWLGKRRTAESARGLTLQVYRLLEDEIPALLTTRVHLDVSGEGREEVLAAPLPAGFTPLRLSSELAARLDAGGRLHVQVRPGSFDLELLARAPGIAGVVARPVAEGIWPREEVWSFAGVDRLRVAAPEGGAAIDPAQAGVPEDWRSHPAFRMSPGSELKIVERSRGLAAADDNHLTLVREQWLDFDHGGYTVVDNLRGTLRSGWRLEMAAPYRLASARSDGDHLLITEVDGRAGVEVRTPRLALTTIGRIAGAGGALPATGWTTRFEHVRGVLNLPPGHRLLGVPGADEAPGSWWSQWTLWSLFGVLIVIAFTHRIAGRVVAAVALFALALGYQEAPLLIWLWANLLVAVAVARAAAAGRFAGLASRYRWGSFALLGLILLPFLWGQIRLAIYPQLEAPGMLEWALGARPPAPAMARATLRVPVEEEAVPERPVPAAAPPLAPSAGMKRAANEPATLPQVVVTAAQREEDVSLATRYAPGTLMQTGPGIPAWHYRRYEYAWSGPVEPDDRVRFVVIGPLLLALWRLAGVAAVALWFLWLLQHSATGSHRLPGWLARLERPGAGGATRAVVAVLLLTLALAPSPGHAGTTPDPALLQELRNRLLTAPPCTPDCGDVQAARVSVAGDELEVALEVSALANIALPVPHAADRWQIEHLSVDGANGIALAREGDGGLWVPLKAGAHRVVLQGRLAPVESVQLAFPRPPYVVSVSASGWDVAGVNEGRLVAGVIELTRVRMQRGTALESGAEFPPFVRVTRDFKLDIDWTLATTVERVAPAHAAFSVEVPLVAGESVITEGIDVRRHDGSASALVGLAAGAPWTRWNSTLPIARTLELVSPTDAARSEVWNFRVSPQWRVSFAGFPAVLPENPDAAVWVYQYRPRPGESLKLVVSRPPAAAGATLAIDSVAQHISYGKRAADVALDFAYRSTQGGRHTLTLPPDARVQTVRVDGEELPLRPTEGRLSLNLLPGEHQVAIQYQSPRGATLRSASADVDLGAPASNVATTIELPAARWPLLATATIAGPVIRYWGELVVFLLTAWLLGRWPISPLRTHEWLLLGLGLSTLSWSVFGLVAIWLYALRWRERWNVAGVERWRLLLVQSALALLTVIAVGSLVFSGIRYGFLSSPDMGVGGTGSYDSTFTWFHDQVRARLPAVAVYSVPIWLYKTLMFAWALWIALALTRWLRWAWSAWTQGLSRDSSSAQRE